MTNAAVHIKFCTCGNGTSSELNLKKVINGLINTD
jgi:hypothetical protein